MALSQRNIGFFFNFDHDSVIYVMKNNPYKDLAKQDIAFFDRKKYSLLFLVRHFFKNSEFLKNIDLELRKNIAATLQKKKSKGEVFELARVKDIGPEEFRKKFINPGIPVIFERGCVDWPCASKWNFEYLESVYSETDFNLTYQKGFTPEDEAPGNDYHDKIYERIKVKDLIYSIKTDGKKYMRFCPIMEDHPELIKDLNLSWIKKMRVSLMGCSYQSFIGAKNRMTPIHNGMTAFFFVLPCGQKKWTLFPTAYKPIISPEITLFGHNYSDVKIKNPDLEKYPGMNLIDRYEGVLNEGDILYCPAWMWHEVENYSDTWGVSCRIPHATQAATQSFSFLLKRIFLTDPPFWKVFYYSFFGKNSSARDKHLIHPKIIKD